MWHCRVCSGALSHVSLLVKGRRVSGTQEQGELRSCLVLLLSLPLLECLTSAAALKNVRLLLRCQETQSCC